MGILSGARVCDRPTRRERPLVVETTDALFIPASVRSSWPSGCGHLREYVIVKDPDHIWAMTDGKGKIMLAFDSGDSGFVPLTIEQAQQVIESLQHVMKRRA
jgi:hypothetical protein